MLHPDTWGFNFKPQDLYSWFLYLCWAYPWPYGNSLRGNGRKKLSIFRFPDVILVSSSWQCISETYPRMWGLFFLWNWISQNFQCVDHWTFLPLIFPHSRSSETEPYWHLQNLCYTCRHTSQHQSMWEVLSQSLLMYPKGRILNLSTSSHREHAGNSLSALPVPFHSIRCSQSSLKWGQRAPSDTSS